MHRAWCKSLSVPRYQPFWDGKDYVFDFDSERDLIKAMEDYFGPDWKNSVEIHQFQVIQTRIK